MAPHKSPAFSFYAKDFLTGTAVMSLAEVGAYVKLLAYQWDAGAVPKSNRDRARILGCSVTQERIVWARISDKFLLAGDAYQNERLEEERGKQAERREKLADNGRLGGRPGKLEVKQKETNRLPEKKANENLNKSLSSSSSSSSSVREKEEHTQATIQGTGAYEPGSLPKDHMHHALCGKGHRLCLSYPVFGKFEARYGGSKAEARSALQGFVDRLETEHQSIGNYLWLEDHFTQFLRLGGRIQDAQRSDASEVRVDERHAQTLRDIMSGKYGAVNG